MTCKLQVANDMLFEETEPLMDTQADEVGRTL